MKYELLPLPYDRDALEPQVGAETLDYHHGKHHAGYVEKFNELVEDSPHVDHPIERILAEGARGTLFNQAAQHWNHSFYWHCLSPDGGGEPKGALADSLAEKWPSLDDFRKEFGEAATGTFGSGWAWLVRGGEGLEIVSTKDAGNPLRDGKQPLLTCDVWEHAYYLDHRNDRGAYLEAFWKLVNWNFAARNLEEAWTLPRS